MSWLSELFHGGKNPANNAQEYLNKIPGATKPYYEPYINQGQTANADLMERYKQLLNDPNALLNKFGEGYKESPGYQTRLKAGLQGAGNAAAAGGMAGSPQHQLEAAERANELQGKDYEDYLNHILGLFGTGLQGEQGLGEQGFKASTGYGDLMAQLLGSQAQYGYAGQAAQNANKANLLNNFVNLGTSTLPYFMKNNNQWNNPGAIPGWQ